MRNVEKLLNGLRKGKFVKFVAGENYNEHYICFNNEHHSISHMYAYDGFIGIHRIPNWNACILYVCQTIFHMNIIFLDIDGVLNSVDSMVGLRKSEYNREERLDSVSVGLLRRLCEETDAKIVISSTWRKLYTMEEFKGIFAYYGWPKFPIIGVTPSMSGSIRGYEIQHWLDSNPWEKYVILDDDSDMLESQSEQFVHVSNIHGLRSTHYCKALRILGKPNERLEQQVNWKK